MWGPWENVVCLFSSDPTDVAAETIQVPNCLLFTCTLLLVLFTRSIALVYRSSTVLFEVAMYLPLDYVQVAVELPCGIAGDHFTEITITSESIFIIDSITGSFSFIFCSI